MSAAGDTPSRGRGRFVGREAERQVLSGALADALAGRGRLVLLSGEPGIGKTRTCEEVAADARQHAARVLWGRCFEGEGAPAFWPWVQVLRGCVDQFAPDVLRDTLGASAADLAQIVPTLREQLPELAATPPSESPEARFRLFDSVARFLGVVARRAPLVLILDDLHGADRSSWLLLEFVTRALRGMPVLVVGTYRDVGLGAERPLTDTIVDLMREPATERLTLCGLSEPDVAEFLEASLAARPPATVVTQLHQRTEGNPLFVGEFVRVLAAEGVHESSPAAAWNVAIPHSVQAVIERRLAPLSAACRQALRVAAVIGREFSLAVLASVLVLMGAAAEGAGGENQAALDALAEAEEAGGVEALRGSPRRYRFAHALIGETLYETLRADERAQLHHQVGEAIERLPDVAEHLSELAYHFYEVGGGDSGSKAILYARRAGDRAMALLAYEEAVRLYHVALELLEQSGAAQDAARCAVLVDLGIAQREACDLETSKATLLRAAELAKRLGLREELARAALHFGTKVVWGEHMFPDHALLQLLEEATAAWGDIDSPLQARLLARLAFALLFSRERERRSSVSRRAVEMARRLDDPAVVAEALHAWLAAHWRPDTLAERMTLAREMTQRAEQAHVVDLVLLGNNWRWTTLMESGQLSAANAVREVYDRLVATCRDPLHRWLAVCSRAALSIQEGRFAEAEGLVQRSLTLEQAVNNGPPLGSFAIMNTLWLAQGRRDALETMLDSQRTAPAAAPPIVRQSTIASIACELNRSAEARVEFEQLAARQFADVRYDEMWLMFMQGLAEVCAFLNDLPRAERLLELLSAYETRVVINPLTKIYVGPVSQSLALLETTLSRWEDAIRHFEHALEKHREMRARPALARTEYEFGRMLLARGEAGDERRARTLLEEALATARELEMPLLIERVEALEGENLQSGVGCQKEAPAVPVTQPSSTELRRDPTPETCLFRREGHYWTITYAGMTVRLKVSKGLQYLAHLLRHPGREFVALDLVRQGSGVSDEVPGSRSPPPGTRVPEPILDAHAKQEYTQRLRDLRDELAEAEANNDLGRVEHVRAEIEMIAMQMRSALGLGGRDRTAANDLERARSAVGKRIRAEIQRIRAAHPTLGRHLAATVTTGYFCGYQPERDVTVVWEL